MNKQDRKQEPAALSIANAREMLGGVSRTTLWKLTRTGQLDARKLGSRTVILADSLRAYLSSLPSA